MFLMQIPIMLYARLPPHPAYQFLDYVVGGNKLLLGNKKTPCDTPGGLRHSSTRDPRSEGATRSKDSIAASILNPLYHLGMEPETTVAESESGEGPTGDVADDVHKKRPTRRQSKDTPKDKRGATFVGKVIGKGQVLPSAKGPKRKK